MRRAVVGAVALCLIGGTAARAQGADDLGSLLAVIQEHFGQSMGEAVLGGQSVFVTAKGSVKLPAPPHRSYDVTVEAQGPTAVQAARLRDDKVDKLKAVATRFSAPMVIGEPSYLANRPVIAPRITLPTGTPPVVTVPSPNAPPPPAGTAAAGQVTARVPVQFTRPPPAQMPAFLDALREAGVDTLPDTNAAANPLAQLTQIFGLGGAAPTGGMVDEETWSRASAAAMQAARAQAESLAAPAGRHAGAVRQVMLLSRSVQNGEATVSVAARFGFAPDK
jgi:hypothetical protein